MEGRIIRQISNDYTVLADREYICKARGVFRNNSETPLVGDIVEFNPNKKLILKGKLDTIYETNNCLEEDNSKYREIFALAFEIDEIINKSIDVKKKEGE